ncbi:uncharacterized protein LOC144450054 [Glandiceps talaboti]
MSTLFVAEEWNRAGDPVSVLNCQLATSVARCTQQETHCVVLKAKHAEANNVKLTLPCFDDFMAVEVQDEVPSCKWLGQPETYFTTLSSVQNVETIVGHFPKTCAAAFAIKRRLFPDAKVVLINHTVPSSAEESKRCVKFAELAYAVFSVGPKVFQYFCTIYQAANRPIKHELYLPRPDECFFDLQVDVIKPKVVKKQMLMKLTNPSFDNTSKMPLEAVSKVADAFHDVDRTIPDWFIRNHTARDSVSTRTFLKNNVTTSYLLPNIVPPYDCQDDICTDLRQSYVCIIPPDESIGMEGLDAIASGLPTLVPKSTAVGEFYKAQFELHADYFVYDPGEKDDLYKKLKSILLHPEGAAKNAKAVKDLYHDNQEVEQTRKTFLSHLLKPTSTKAPRSMTSSTTASEHVTSDGMATKVSSETSQVPSDDVAIHSEKSEQRQQGHVSSDIENLTTVSGVSTAGNTEDTSRLSPSQLVPGTQYKVSNTGLDLSMNTSKERKLSPTIQVETKLEITDEPQLKHRNEVLKTEAKEQLMKLAIEHYQRRTKILLEGGNPELIQELDNGFNACSAVLERAAHGSLCFILSFLLEEDMEYFWPKYESGELEESLTGILVTPEMRALAEKAGCTARIKLQIDKKEFDIVKQIMHDMSAVSSPSTSTECRATQYDKWERYILNHVQSFLQAKYLIEESIFDPVLDTVRNEEFFFPAIVSYWYQNSYTLPPTLTTATEYAIKYHVEMYCKENTLDVENAWQVVQDRFLEVGKCLYENLTEDNLGVLYESWMIESKITDMHEYLFALVKNSDKCHGFEFSNQYVYSYIIACYMCTRLKTTENFHQMKQEIPFILCKNKLPCLLSYMSGILGDKADIVIVAIAKAIKQERFVMNSDLVNLGHCLFECQHPTLFAESIERVLGQQTLDLSSVTVISNQTLHALSVILQNTSVIGNILLYSDKIESQLSSDLKLKTGMEELDNVDFDISNSQEFVVASKFLRVIPLLKCIHSKSGSTGDTDKPITSKCDTVCMKFSKPVCDIDVSYIQMFLQSFSCRDVPRKLKLIGMNEALYHQMLECMACQKTRPTCSLTSLSLTQSTLNIDDCILLVKVLKSLPCLQSYSIVQTELIRQHCRLLLKDVKDSVHNLPQIPEISKKHLSLNELGNMGIFDQLLVVTGFEASELHQEECLCICQELGVLRNLERLTLTKCVITCDAVSYLSQSLRNVSTLKVLNLSHNNIGYLGAQSLSSGMENMGSLTYLDLSHNKIGYVGVESLSKVMEYMGSLTYLDLSHNNIGYKGIESLSRVMMYMGSLTYLDLSHNNIGYKGVESLSRGMEYMGSLTYLDLSYNIIGDERIESLSRGMEYMGNLTYLDLSHNIIRDQGVESLSRGMEYMGNLTYLDLSHNKIGDQGVKSLSTVDLTCLKVINTLDLSYNCIGARGIQTLLNGIQDDNILSKVDVSHNWSGLGDMIIPHIKKQIRQFPNTPDYKKDNLKLCEFQSLFKSLDDVTVLDISTNMHWSQKEMIEVCKDISVLNKLHKLTLSNNNIGSQGVESLSRGMMYMGSLTYLDLSHNNIGYKGVESLSRGMEYMDFE